MINAFLTLFLSKNKVKVFGPVTNSLFLNKFSFVRKTKKFIGDILEGKNWVSQFLLYQLTVVGTVAFIEFLVMRAIFHN